ncbi:hypothetical protein L8R85_26045, partial [Vibrio splendidus]|nr:hypothetical protein [Vibrio splendidus]
MNNRFKYLLSALGGLLLLAVIVAPIGLYISNMGKGLSSVSENWGDFGSYLGGTISSITGSFSLLIIAISLVMQINDRRRDVYAKNLESRIKYIDALIQRTDDNLKYFESEMNLKRDISMLNSSKNTTEVDKNKDA